VQDPALNKIDALLTRQRFDCEPVARIFLKSLYRIELNHLSIHSVEAEWHKSCMFSLQCG
jgi:hypothetical protein